MASLVAKLGLSILKSLITEAFLKEIILAGLRLAAKSSKNTLDDQVVAAVEKAWDLT